MSVALKQVVQAALLYRLILQGLDRASGSGIFARV